MRIFLIVLALLAVSCSSNPGDQLIHHCSSNMQVDVMAAGRILKEHPETARYADSNGTTALHAACASWNFIVVTGLLKAGAPVNAQDKNGNTPLHLALGPIEGMNYGASENLPGSPLTEEQKKARGQLQSQVALNQSVNRKDIVRYLLAAGADITLKNKEGKTPLEFCDQSQKVYDHVIELQQRR